LLALAERAIEDLGGVIAYKDTDGFIVTASRASRPGKLQLASGEFRRILTYDEICSAMAHFACLDPFGDGQPFFETKAEGTAAVFAPKKYGIVGEEGNPVAHTESGIGAFLAPPGFGARQEDGRQVFTADIAAAHVERPGGPLDILPWERRHPDWPAFQRHSFSTPRATEELPVIFGRRPFQRVVEAIATYGDAHPVALDPGGALEEADLSFWDGRSGRPIDVTTRPEQDGVVIDSLRARAVEWGKTTVDDVPAVVILDEALARRVGKAGALFVDESDQLVYEDVDQVALFMRVTGALGAPLLAELSGLPERTARAIGDGRLPLEATVERAMASIAERLGSEYLPRLLDLVEEAGSLSCRWPGCAGRPARTGATWCSLHRRRSGTDRRRVLEEAG
jgi:hypothetical protein